MSWAKQEKKKKVPIWTKRRHISVKSEGEKVQLLLYSSNLEPGVWKHITESEIMF